MYLMAIVYDLRKRKKVMANYTIGDIVFESRTARGYSQEELSFGICATSSLSRIENSGQIPGRKIFEALMQRLGISDSLYSAYISKNEMEVCKLIQKLVWSLEKLNFEESEKIVEDLEGRLGRNNELERQYVAFAKARIFLNREGNHEKFFEMLLDTIRMTINDFEPQKGIQRRLLTFHEITILSNIATELYNNGKKNEGLNLLFELKEYMDTHIIDEEEKAKKYPFIVYNITTRLGMEKRFIEAYNLCDQAVSFCIEHNKLMILPYLLTNKASAAAELHKLSEAKELFCQALVLFRVCKMESQVEKIKFDTLVRYGLDLS